MKAFRNSSVGLAVASTALFAALMAGGCAIQNVSRADRTGHWSTSWGASATVPAANSAGFSDQTLRMIVHASAGGTEVRIKLSNVFGSKPLNIGGAGIALQQSGASLVAGSNRILTFGGRPSVSIPIGAYVLSDSAQLPISAQHDLAVSLFISGDSGPVSAHPLALQTSFVSSAGNFVARDDAGPFQNPIQAWPYLAGVEVSSVVASSSIVAFGDSITDGYKSTADSNRRWPDFLSNRLFAAHKDVAVVNEGISGNRIWHDAIPARLIFGPNGLSRFDRDALAITGVSHIVVLLGINDIGQASAANNPGEQVSAEDVIVGLQQFALRAHAHHVRIIAGTLTPYKGAAYFDATGEQKRTQVNAWIRSSKDFDAVIDFDASIRDPNLPTQLQAAYDSGDHLHPNDAGYKAMAESIDLSLFD